MQLGVHEAGPCVDVRTPSHVQFDPLNAYGPAGSSCPCVTEAVGPLPDGGICRLGCLASVSAEQHPDDLNCPKALECVPCLSTPWRWNLANSSYGRRLGPGPLRLAACTLILGRSTGLADVDIDAAGLEPLASLIIIKIVWLGADRLSIERSIDQWPASTFTRHTIDIYMSSGTARRSSRRRARSLPARGALSPLLCRTRACRVLVPLRC